jgi:hypothetical protein
MSLMQNTALCVALTRNTLGQRHSDVLKANSSLPSLTLKRQWFTAGVFLSRISREGLAGHKYSALRDGEASGGQAAATVWRRIRVRGWNVLLSI